MATMTNETTLHQSNLQRVWNCEQACKHGTQFHNVLDLPKQLVRVFNQSADRFRLGLHRNTITSTPLRSLTQNKQLFDLENTFCDVSTEATAEQVSVARSTAPFLPTTEADPPPPIAVNPCREWDPPFNARIDSSHKPMVLSSLERRAS